MAGLLTLVVGVLGLLVPTCRAVAAEPGAGAAGTSGLTLDAAASPDGSTLLTARLIGSTGDAPIVIAGSDGAVVAACGTADTCSARVAAAGAAGYIARSGDVFSEPVLVEASGEGPSALRAVASGEPVETAYVHEDSGIDNGWSLTIGVRTNGESASWEGFGNSTGYSFYAAATPPAGVDPEGYEIWITDLDSGNDWASRVVVAAGPVAAGEVSGQNYNSYSGFAQHRFAVQVIHGEYPELSVGAQLEYEGWYDRYVNVRQTSFDNGFRAGDAFRLRFGSDQVADSGGRYAAYVEDATTGELLGRCVTTECTIDATFVAATRRFRSWVADASDPSLHVAATTLPREFQKGEWYTWLAQYGPVENGRVPVIMPSNQDVGLTNGLYKDYLLDVTTGTVVDTCTSGPHCYSSIDVSLGHVYVNIIASSSGPGVDIQAVSDPLYMSATGPILVNGMRRETSGGFNPSESFCQECAGDPVNTVTGEFWEQLTDLDAGGGLGFSRSYASSLADVDSALGRGWNPGWGMRLEIAHDATGSTLGEASQVVVVQENGSFVPFARVDGGLVTFSRFNASLGEQADGTYVFTRTDGIQYTFAASGLLTSVQDPNQNVRTLSYDGQDRLVSIGDMRGRTLTLGWADGHIASVTDQTARTVRYSFTTAGDLEQQTAPDGGVTRYEYDGAHRLIAVVDPGGARIENSYDAQGRVVSQSDGLGRVTALQYATDSSADGATITTTPDGARTRIEYTAGAVTSRTSGYGTSLAATSTSVYVDARLVATTSALGNTTTFTYDDRGNRTSVTDPLGRVTTSTYDQWNNPTSATNPAGEISTMTYDERGNLLTSIAPDGAATSFTLNSDGTTATATDPVGQVTAFAYDAHGFTASIASPDGALALTQYDTLGNLVSSTDPRGMSGDADAADFTSTYTYDAAGRRLTGTDPLGALVTWVYDAVGQPTSVTDASGATTTSEYDAAGQLVAVVDAAGGRTTMTYDGAGRVLSVTDAVGSVTSRAYDALGRTTSVTDALGRVTSMEYDAGNRVTAQISPSGARTTFTYDAAGQLLTTTDALGDVTTTTYDAAGRPVTVSDADGRAATSTYDQAGRPASVVRADGSTVGWEYDPAGLVTAYIDASGARSTTTYDAAGRRASYTDTAGRTTTYTYDVAGLLASVTQAGGAVTTSTYDAAGRRTGTDYSDDTPDMSTAYDVAGRVTSITDGTGVTGYVYDVLGRVVQVDRDGASVGYAWDGVNQLTDLTYPTGQVVHRTYDAAGQLMGVKDWAGQTYAFTYDADGSTTQIAYPNGVLTSFDHDATGQTLGVTTTTSGGEDLLDLAYAYTDAGQLTDQTTTRSTQSRAPPVAATTTSTYTWDALGRIAQVTGDQAATFAFDAAGSLTTLGDGQTRTYDTARQLTTATTPAIDTTTAVTAGFTYDARGNRATTTTDTGDAAGMITHTYNQANQLTTLTGVDGTATTYTYDAVGLRASATTTTGTGVTDDHYTWDTLASIPELLTDATHAYLYGATSTPLAQYGLTDSTIDYLHSDLLGSIRTTTDTTAAVTSDADYDTYGRPLVVTTDPTSAITRFGYAGEYTDLTGYLYLRARYYDPTTAQFLTRDPLEATTGNPYGYTGGNPLQYTDPRGLDWLGDDTWPPVSGWPPTASELAPTAAGSSSCSLSSSDITRNAQSDSWWHSNFETNVGQRRVARTAGTVSTVSGYLSGGLYLASAILTATGAGLPVAGVCAKAGNILGWLSTGASAVQLGFGHASGDVQSQQEGLLGVILGVESAATWGPAASSIAKTAPAISRALLGQAQMVRSGILTIQDATRGGGAW